MALQVRQSKAPAVSNTFIFLGAMPAVYDAALWRLSAMQVQLFFQRSHQLYVALLPLWRPFQMYMAHLPLEAVQKMPYICFEGNISSICLICL